VLEDNVEELRLVGPTARTGTGNELDNLLVGSGGADTLDGSIGNDTINGNGGGDNIIGGEGDDLLRGNDGFDQLFGGIGNDRLEGGADIDILDGGAGVDTLIGGAGRDTMTGGAGADRFVFGDGDSSDVLGNADMITDFSQSDGDRIDLRTMDAIAGGEDDAFTFVGTDAFTGTAGELRYEQVGSETRIFGDTDGDGAADFIIRLDDQVTLTVADFMV
jgi:Ca2+-binding RTX toxin-like protein